ncbi:NDP-sugar synthase [Paenibacillus larvae]|uniref:NDP-sugar synthase n=1 Tax=Paenibacillus larvae TaxID=1464 RepID=UPI00288F63D3|nr:NDP-sugar synthase [Paenibacillus larvae]MDT2194571.1 NDP-sugar synthase [Paenibacillus larvae]MDT2241745.1 NDP-sugar synthase [Paenibacillus larvae]MDT2254741.1 NDP-sugar synthase [Paenibacillus larvae]MDT2261098.1 NDP-sugar synthase [Paenibacillus larvae]MDT2264402.1 NDP-sugar synthase [Paenibacillus larvae]
MENTRPARTVQTGEYELTDAIQLLIDQGKHVAYCITTEPFFDIGTPERWLDANRYKVSKDSRKQNIKKQLFHSTDTAIISPVHIDPSVKLYQSVIGPYVYIGPGCILNCCRIENSILTDHVQLSHVFVRDSIFGSNVKFSGPVDDTKPAKFIMGDKSKVEE